MGLQVQTEVAVALTCPALTQETGFAGECQEALKSGTKPSIPSKESLEVVELQVACLPSLEAGVRLFQLLVLLWSSQGRYAGLCKSL